MSPGNSGSNFNPHSREGSDWMVYRVQKGIRISIHTPAKGVTIRPIQMMLCIAISIHTPAKGVTKMFDGIKRLWKDFNPHSREGSDENVCPNVRSLRNFNPHSREGSDAGGRTHLAVCTISIHTPAKGVTTQK